MQQSLNVKLYLAVGTQKFQTNIDLQENYIQNVTQKLWYQGELFLPVRKRNFKSMFPHSHEKEFKFIIPVNL